MQPKQGEQEKEGSFSASQGREVSGKLTEE